MAFIILMYVPSIPTLVRVFIMNGCWTSSNAFSASIETIVWFLSFLLVMWYMMLIDFHMLNHACEPGMNPTWLWCMIFFICCWIRMAKTLLRIFESIFSEILAYSFLFLVVSSSGFGITVMVAS